MGSLNRYTLRGASSLPSAIQEVFSIFAQISLLIGAYTSFFQRLGTEVVALFVEQAADQYMLAVTG
ncbi:hypothetical protein PPS11_35035 [Pseudomonas putida S11]|nr:hypothetical protein PPS11_35035 [Pseudomonas putida S11]